MEDEATKWSNNRMFVCGNPNCCQFNPHIWLLDLTIQPEKQDDIPNDFRISAGGSTNK